MKQPLLGLLLACALTAPSWAEEAETPTIVPVTNAAFHSVVFQNDNMSLVSVTLPPGTSTGYHSHDQDLVFAITAGAKINIRFSVRDPLVQVRRCPFCQLHEKPGSASNCQC